MGVTIAFFVGIIGGIIIGSITTCICVCGNRDIPQPVKTKRNK